MNSLKTIFDYDTWQEIFGSIAKNKIRTVVTVIGVLWGIFIYITLSGSAKGLDNGFDREFQDMAMNSMFVWPQSTSIPYAGFKIGRSPRLTTQNVKTLKQQVPEIQYIAPRNARGVRSGPPASVVYRDISRTYNIYGDYPEYSEISTKKIYKGGRFINNTDITNKRKVCVIGERTEKELFEEDENPVGKFIRIDNVYFQVIGVHKYNPGGGFETDGDIFIPFETFRNLYNTGDKVNWFVIAAYDNADVILVEKKVKKVLKRIHKISPDDERAFGSFNIGEVFNRIKGFADGMTFLSLVVGLATIIAGVIGIGNILLISVKERTKELGVRRALGATPGEVRIQIVLESVFLTLIAGVLGIILGAAALATINFFTQDLAEFPYTNPTVPPLLVLGALLIMTVMGTLIGLIPAQRAVSIKPIDALREE
ncbi:MAG: ABC transporter permease [Flavobacteriaceae bacterium]